MTRLADILPSDVAQDQEEIQLQWRVWQAMQNGATAKEIAAKMGLSSDQVKGLARSGEYRDWRRCGRREPIHNYLAGDFFFVSGFELARRLRHIKQREIDEAEREKREAEREKREAERRAEAERLCIERMQMYQANLHCFFEVTEKFWTEDELIGLVVGMRPSHRFLREERLKDHRKFQRGS